jgi:hypothetical protein
VFYDIQDEIPTDPGSRKRRFKKMLSNIKLPHWLMGIIGAIGVILPYIMKQEMAGVFTVPTWVIPTENAIMGLLIYFGLASPSVSPTINARAMAMVKKVGPTIFITGILYLGGDTACSNGTSVPSTVVAPTIQTTSCILTNTAIDLFVSHDTWQATVADVIKKCGTDLATITTVWDSHVNAEISEGITPKFTIPADAGN